MTRLVVPIGVCVFMLLAGFGLTPTRGADERHLEFAHRLQEQGLADISVEYLRQLQQRDDVADALKADLGYEIGKALAMMVEDADAETGQGLLSEAEQTLTRFLKEYEDSDLANACLNELASVRLQQGQRILGRAEAEKEAARRSQGREDARRRFEAAHQDFVTAISKYRQRLSDTSPEQPEKTAPEPAKTAKTKPGLPKSPAAKKPKTKPKSAPKADEKDPKLEADLILARINLASTDFFIARTYDGGVEQEKKQRDQRINTAIQEFDNLFQEYRGAFAGFVAHLWHGRALEEQGDLRQALMIYDEIIVNEPPKGAQIPKDQAALFTQAELFRLSVLNKQGKHSEVMPEASQWLNSNQDKRRSSHGLGIQLELAKASIALGQKMTAGSAERRAAFARAMQILNNEVGKFRSPYLDEAFRLRAQHAGEVSAAGGKIASFDEGQFVGDAALAKDPPQFEAAIKAYELALTMANDKTDPTERDATVYRLSYAYFRTGDFAKSLTLAEDLARSNPQSKWAPECAALAVVSCNSAYAAAKTNAEKQTELARLESIASFLEEHWPKHSQADVARRSVGAILMYRREFLRAAEIYERINSQSALYAEGQSKAGQAYWNAFLTELGKPESDRDKQAMSELVQKAKSALETSLAVQGAGSGSITQLRAETQLLLAEIALKESGHSKATALLEPLLPLVKSGEHKELAGLADRILVGAMEAAIAQGDLNKAEALMGDLEQQGADTTRLTLVLVGLGRGLEQQLRQHEAAGRTAEAAAVRESFESFLGKLAGRERQSFGSLQYLAESYFAMGNYEKAGELFERMIRFLQQDPAAAGAKGMSAEFARVRLRRATALRLTNQFNVALSELDALLKENERLLAAIMEKGRVLQDWGGQDASKLADAAKHWDQASKRLQAISPRPAEYFEARYGLAWSLSKLGKKTDAIKVLRSTMALSAGVGGPELRAKYESLLRELEPGAASSSLNSPAAPPARRHGEVR